MMGTRKPRVEAMAFATNTQATKCHERKGQRDQTLCEKLSLRLLNSGQSLFLLGPFCKMRSRKLHLWVLAGSSRPVASFPGCLLALKAQHAGYCLYPSSPLVYFCLAVYMPPCQIHNKRKCNQLPSKCWQNCEGYYKFVILKTTVL